MKKERSHFKKGFSLVEVILASALVLLLLTGLMSAYLYGQESGVLAGKRVFANLLAEEGLEAVRSVRDNNFEDVTVGTYGIATSSNVWILSGSSDSVGEFTREILISEPDTNCKDVVVNVTWQQTFGRSGLVSMSTRLTNWMREVIVAGDWSAPTTTSIMNLSGNNNGEKVAIQGDYAYVARNGGGDLTVIDISDPENPSVADTLDLNGRPFNIFVSGDYAYIASNSNSQELQIVDISNPTNVSLTGTYNDSGNHDARGIMVVGSTAYLAMNGGDDLILVDVSSPSSPTFIGGTSLSGSAYDVFVSGDYAYIASNSNSREVQVIDISTPTSPSYNNAMNLSGNANALNITGFGSTVVVGRSGNGEVHTVNISNPLVPVELDSYSVGDDVRDIGLGNSNQYTYIGTDLNAGEFHILDITDTSDILFLSSLNMSSDINGVAYDAVQDITVAVGENNSEELYVFSPD